jgi:hypothetical protein
MTLGQKAKIAGMILLFPFSFVVFGTVLILKDFRDQGASKWKVALHALWVFPAFLVAIIATFLAVSFRAARSWARNLLGRQ